MFLATAIVTLLLTALLAAAAARKLSHRPAVVASYQRLGVPEVRLNYLAAILLAGALGLVLGLWWAPIGVAAAVGVVGYFLMAIGFHLRARDAKNLPTPATFLALALAALLLRLATL